MIQVTVRHGSATSKTWTCKVFAQAIDPDGGRTTVRLNSVLDSVSNQGTVNTNGVDSSNGMWFGSVLDGKTGDVVVMKAIQYFMKAQSAMAVLPIRLREDGPLIVVKGNFPVMREFQNRQSMMLFSGRGDILDRKDIETLGLVKSLHPNDWRNGFDEEELEECFDITIHTNVSGYAPKPEFVEVKERGVVVGAKAVPKMHQRRIRIPSHKKEPEVSPPVRGRRRRR